MDAQREHVRHLLRVPASLTDPARQCSWPAQIIDIARMGVAFVTNEAMATDTVYQFHFCFPGSGVVNEVTLRLLYSRPLGAANHFRNGARFEAVSEDCVQRIVDYVTSSAEAGDA